MVAIWLFCCDVKVDSINAMVQWKYLLETNDLQKHNNNVVIKAEIILLVCLTAMFSVYSTTKKQHYSHLCSIKHVAF